MTFFAILLAVLLDQARTSPVHAQLDGWLAIWFRWVHRTMDAGAAGHVWLVWLVSLGGPVLATVLLSWLFWSLAAWLYLVWYVLVLYSTLGFRTFSHHFTAVRMALESGDEVAARRVMAQWQGSSSEPLSRTEWLRRVLSWATLSVHRQVFGVVSCCVALAWLGLGPAGAVLYRTAQCLQREATTADGTSLHARMARVAAQGWAVIDWLPARCTAACFAVVGNFEEAVAMWRAESGRLPHASDRLILAATAGALGARLHTSDGNWLGEGGDIREPQLSHLAALVGLVWRSVLLWMLVLGLFTLARLLG